MRNTTNTETTNAAIAAFVEEAATIDCPTLHDAAAHIDTDAIDAACCSLTVEGVGEDGEPDWDVPGSMLSPLTNPRIDWDAQEDGDNDQDEGWARWPVRGLTVRGEPVWVRIQWDTQRPRRNDAWTVFSAQIEAGDDAIVIGDDLAANYREVA